MSRPPLKGTKLNCANKIRYADEFPARVAAMESINRHGTTDKLWVYRCPHCSGWHLTRSRQRTAPTTATELVAA